jgi:hypothetical protein
LVGDVFIVEFFPATSFEPGTAVAAVIKAVFRKKFLRELIELILIFYGLLYFMPLSFVCNTFMRFNS